MTVVMVTGASAGFGEAMARLFVEKGYDVIGTGRRYKKLVDLQNELGEHFYPLQMDMTSTEVISQALETLDGAWKTVDILVNNAGLALGLDKAYQADFADWSQMIETNIIGLAYLTHQVLPQMVERKKGYIINIGSTAGTVPYPGANVYGATKAFVKQFSLNLRADLAGTGIRVSNVEPGLCEGTEFSLVRFKGDQERTDNLYKGAHAIKPEDIANTVLWLMEQPPHINVNRIEIMPTSQSFGPQPVERRDD